MADAATQTQDPSPDIASLTGDMPASDSSAIADLTKLKKQQIGEENKVIGAENATISRDQARMEQAYKAEGVETQALKPWDANKEHEKFESDPVQGLGSVGSIFAVIASAFTKAPATNAIEGVAGALNSIKEGNEAAYKRAYDSYKENMKLAIERQKIQHEQYQDAASLMQHNMAAGAAKMHNLAVKFGDQNTLMFLEHGMSKELFEMMDARATAAEHLQEFSDKTTERSLRDQAFKTASEGLPKTGDPAMDAAHKLELFNRTHLAVKETAQQSLMGQFFLEHPTATAEEAATFADKHGIIRQFGSSAGASNIPGRVETDMVKKRMAEIMHQDPEISETDAYTEAKREIKVEGTAPSANKIDELRGKRDQADNLIDGSKKNLEFLHQYKGGAGIMGKIMRGEEIASNVVGAGTETDRVAFRRRVEEMQLTAPRILADTTGRPLKEMQEKVDDIVAGLKSGDTSPNSIRAYEDFIADIEKRKQDYSGRLEHSYKAGEKSSGAAAGTAQPSPGGTDWLSAYPEKK